MEATILGYTNYRDYRDYCSTFFPIISLIMENQMEKKMENEMEAGII